MQRHSLRFVLLMTLLAVSVVFSGTVHAQTDQPTRLYPADDAVLNDSSAGWPRFTFEAMDGIEWYQVWIGDASYAQPAAVFEWYPATDTIGAPFNMDGICEEGVCTIPTDLWLVNGDYVWWMTYYGPDDQNTADYWNETTFSVNFPTPGSGFNFTVPGDPVVMPPLVISWAHDPGVLWYNLWIGSDDYINQFYFEWVDGNDICDNIVCSLDVDNIPFNAGAFEVWIELWGPNGYVGWTDVPNSPLSFEVDPTLNNPVITGFSANPVPSDNIAVMQTLSFTNGDGNPIDSLYWTGITANVSSGFGNFELISGDWFEGVLEFPSWCSPGAAGMVLQWYGVITDDAGDESAPRVYSQYCQ